jgi:hypothetical protein
MYIITFVKELLRNFVALLLKPIFFIFSLSRIRLVYLDESRIGHFFADSLTLLTNVDIGNKICILPVISPCSNFLIAKYTSKNLIFYKSKLLKLITAWFRHESYFIINMTYSLNFVFEKNILSREIVFKPKFIASEILYRNLFSINDEINARKFILDKYKINGDNYCFYNQRSLTHDNNNSQRHSFRNLKSFDNHLLIESLLKHDYYIINASDYIFSYPRVINLRACNDFNIDDIILSVLGCKIYLGDSTGTSVMAQILSKPSFFFNIN